MEIDWIVVRAFWDASGWEYTIVLINFALAYYAFTNYRELASLGSVVDKVMAVAHDAATIGAIQNLKLKKTIEKRIKRVNDEVNNTMAFVMRRVSRIIVLGLAVPVLIITVVVAAVGQVGFGDAAVFTINNLSRGLFLDILEVFDIDLLGPSAEPQLSARLLSVLVILRFTAEATFWFSLASALGAVVGYIRLRTPLLRPKSIEQLNEKLREANENLLKSAEAA